MTARPWYALRALTGREARAVDELADISVEAWLPTYRTRTKPTKKRKPVDVWRPLLPGYVLARPAPDDWPRVIARRHVLGWIADRQGEPLPCRRPQEIERLRHEEAIGLHDHDGIEGRLGPGDPLEVLFGPFAGWAVAFRGAHGRQLEVEVEMLGAPRRVTIPAQYVRLAR